MEKNSWPWGPGQTLEASDRVRGSGLRRGCGDVTVLCLVGLWLVSVLFTLGRGTKEEVVLGEGQMQMSQKGVTEGLSYRAPRSLLIPHFIES